MISISAGTTSLIISMLPPLGKRRKYHGGGLIRVLRGLYRSATYERRFPEDSHAKEQLSDVLREEKLARHAKSPTFSARRFCLD